MTQALRFLAYLLALFSVWSLAGFAPALARVDQAQPLDPKVRSLGIVGYNYTKRYIDSFSVDGADGGNLLVSSPTSGGGGTTCCVSYVPGVSHKRVTIRWQVGGCNYHTRSTDSSDVYEHIHHFFREAAVEVDKPFPADAKYIEVHFQPNGRVTAAITERESPPLLKLPTSREDKSPYPPCPDDKKPPDRPSR